MDETTKRFNRYSVEENVADEMRNLPAPKTLADIPGRQPLEWREFMVEDTNVVHTVIHEGDTYLTMCIAKAIDGIANVIDDMVDECMDRMDTAICIMKGGI
jgi:hypothetical protein